MKIKPCLILTSLSVLLCQVQVTDAQQPQPRFGYGSLPGGAYVIPAPKPAPSPAATAKPAAKPSATPAAKSTTVAKTTAKPATKPVPAKTTVAKASTKPTASPKTPTTKAVASTKSKTKTASPSKTGTKAPARTEVAKTTTPRPASKSAAKPEPTRAIASSAKPAGSRSRAEASTKTPASQEIAAAVVPPSRSTTTSGSPTRSNGNGKALVADITPAPEAKGFHFFGIPVVLPEIPAASTAPAANRNTFVDVLAARHALGETRTPERPNRYTKPDPATEGATQPVITHLAPASMDPSGIATHDAAAAASDASISTDELQTTRSVPASLNLASLVPDTNAAEPSLEATPLDEPALPAPVVSKPVVAEVTAEPPAPEPALPRQDAPATPPSAPSRSLASAADHVAGEHDLSERERAFVRSLAEAAGTVTSASGAINQDLPRSVATAASALMDQVPAETVTSFRSAAHAARKSVQDVVPDLPMEISNDLMPATPDKMPDRLPTFNAAPSGKIDVQSDRQADYDQANNKVIFTGKVELNSAVIRLRADRVEVFMKKGGGGMERVEAAGNVLMRTQDTENGPGQMASAGRASYNLKTGEISLSDWPKIQEAGKSHISTDPSTKMYMFTDGRLRTDGPNRTLIGGAE